MTEPLRTYRDGTESLRCAECGSKLRDKGGDQMVYISMKDAELLAQFVQGWLDGKVLSDTDLAGLVKRLEETVGRRVRQMDAG